MSATNHTTNYELPIFVGTDKPAWLVDWNGAMTAIDTAIHTAEGKADQAGTDIGGIESSISTINGTITSINNAVSQLRIDTNANTGSINTITSLIGNGEPTTTDKTIIGAINELNAVAHDLGLDVTGTMSITASTGTVFASDLSEVNYALNADKSLGKIYGYFRINGHVHTADTWENVAVLASNDLPEITQSYNIDSGLIFGESSGTAVDRVGAMRLVFNTNKTITVQVYSPADSATWAQTYVSLPSNLYILKDLGD